MSAAPSDDGVAGSDAERPALPGRPAASPASDHGNALPVGTSLGEFELLGVLGEGGFGIVYRAWDHSLQRQVAIKEYMPASLAHRTGGAQVSVRSAKHAEPFRAGLQSFVTEARLLAQFDHPALVKVFRFWEANGSAYMVMPFYEGVTLREELKRRGQPPDEATLLGWLGPIADALAILHAEYWFHRDVAPDNVLLLAGSGRPVLLDFGAARRVIGDMTQALTVILKPGYAPVEQYAEIPGMKQGPWTDVYALGALAYNAVCARTPPQSVGRLVDDRFVPLAQRAAGRYSDRVLQAIDHALAVRPENRTPDIAAFKAELGLPPPPVEPRSSDFASTSPETAPIGLDPPVAPAGSAPGAVSETGSAQTHGAAPGARETKAMPAPSTPRTGPRSARTAKASPERGIAPSPAAPSPGAPAASAVPEDPGRRRRRVLAGAALLIAGAGGALWWSGRSRAPAAAPPPDLASVEPAPASGGFDPVEAFRRIVAGQTPAWTPVVTTASARLQAGRDTLVLTIQAPRGGHVYVFSYGADGTLQMIVPNAAGAAPPKLTEGAALTLPGSGEAALAVDGPPGQRHVLVIVSAWPRDSASFAPRVENGFTRFPTGTVAAALEGANAGRLPLIAGQAVCPPQTACIDEFGAALMTLEVTG